MRNFFERKEKSIIAVLICIIGVLWVVIFADRKESAVVETDTVLSEVEEIEESEIEVEAIVESESEEVETVEQEIEQTETGVELQETAVEDWGSFEQYYMDNPIDNILSQQLEKALVEAERRDLQELYKELWLEQYRGMMEFVQNHCIYEEELENYERFAGEIERGYEELQPLIKNTMLDTFEVPSDSPEKATWGWGNGTAARLAMHEGMYYRNACMLLIPFLNNIDGGYDFITAEEVWERVEELYEVPTTITSSVPTSVEETRLAFGKALWDVYQKGILPDGGALDYTSMESARANSFSVIDIDFDGKEELVLRWENACMAGMMEIVYGYEDGVIFKELCEFPSMRFYENGIVEADWSHNQGLAGDFWPYDMYRYDAASDSYQKIGTVDAWDKSLSEKNYEDELFPADIDEDGDGVIYYVLPAEWDWPYNEEYLMDGADYETWRSAQIEDTSEMDIPFVNLTEEKIAELGYPMPYVYVPEPKG
ncbi:MAG: hypothetical protein IJ326_09480 [Lachnospiraceae bacterium]|nr:hypothetical protein [Lachnospiraceae bacterium]